LIPARALSWHCIALPDKVLRGILLGRTEATQIRSVLTGVLEEQLLDDAEALHFAVFATTPDAADNHGNAWVAVCDRTWLSHNLHALEAAGHPVDRIAAECTPLAYGAARATLTAELEPAQMLLCTAQGVSLLPVQAAGISLARIHPALEVLAEPAVMALAEKTFGNQVTLQPRAQRLLQAAQSPWNLAQLEWTASRAGRMAKRLNAFWQQLLHAPAWRPARWSLLALVLVHITALNALAWRQRSQLDDQRAASQAILKQSFPDVQLVVNAPLQMQRAVDDLARARGVGSDTNLASVLARVAPLLPTDMALTSIEFSGSQLRLQAKGLSADALPGLAATLDSQMLRARLMDGAWVIEPKEPR
jgi:general secretion pathway protein L